MLRFDTIIGDIPYLLLGIPLTLAITLVAFVAGILIALPIAVIRSAAVPVLSRVRADARGLLSHDAAVDAHRLGVLRASGSARHSSRRLHGGGRRPRVQLGRADVRKFSAARSSRFPAGNGMPAASSD